VDERKVTDSLTLVDGTRKRWRLELDPERLHLAQVEGADTFDVPREDAYARLGLHTTLASRIVMTVRADAGRKTLFVLSDDALGAIARWLGIDRAAALVTRPFSWVAILVGVLWLIASIPIEGAPEEGVASVPFNMFRFAVGVASIGVGIAGRVRAHASLLLVYGVWCTAVATDNARYVLWGDTSWAWLIPSVFLLALGWAHLRFYRVLSRARPREA
jgi:hypothetical protein